MSENPSDLWNFMSADSGDMVPHFGDIASTSLASGMSSRAMIARGV
jgi:hypothetical protein